MADPVDEAVEAVLAHFGRNLEREVEKKGMTWSELAEAAETSRAALHAMVQGKRAPTLRTVVKLSYALGVEPWKLLKPAK